MNKNIALAGLLATGLVTSAQAVDLETEVVPMTYFKHSFGGTSRSQSFSTYGLQVHKASPLQAPLFDAVRAPAFDLRFREGQLDAMSFAGVNTVRKQLVHHADGSSSTATSIDWGLVVPAAVAAGIILHGVTKDDTAPCVTLAYTDRTYTAGPCVGLF